MSSVNKSIPEDVKAMRRKQMVLLNLFWISGGVIFLTLLEVFPNGLQIAYYSAGLFLIVKSLIDIIHGNSTKRLIPLFQQIAVYEKEKLGSEWRKGSTPFAIMQLLIAPLFFYLGWNSYVPPEGPPPVNYYIFLPAIIFIIVMQNFTVRSRMKEIDQTYTTGGIEYDTKS